MEVFLRVIAIILEIVVLSAIVYAILSGVRLGLNDFGAGPKYTKAIVMALAAVGFILLIFFVAHLTVFYPTF
jgi:succinate dehydrogenase/fumarate reductase cytochrome b subunit